MKNRILVIKLGALGDFIQAAGPMAAIRRHHKEDEITLLTTAPFENFARKCGYFDHIWLDTKPALFDPRGWLALRKKLISGGFKRVYDLQNNDRTSFYFRLFPARNRPEWVGAAKGASHCNDSPLRTAGHAFDGHVQTLALAGITDVRVDNLNWMDGDLSGFPLLSPLVLLVPGSAPTRPEKRWPAEHYAQLARHLATKGYQPVILGSKSEADLAQKISAECKQALNLAGKTDLFQIAALGRLAAAAIGNDTGPIHMIAATGCPVTVLFSAHSNPKRHAPKGESVQVIAREMMKDISLNDVLAAFQPRQ